MYNLETHSLYRLNEQEVYTAYLTRRVLSFPFLYCFYRFKVQDIYNLVFIVVVRLFVFCFAVCFCFVVFVFCVFLSFACVLCVCVCVCVCVFMCVLVLVFVISSLLLYYFIFYTCLYSISFKGPLIWS